LERGERLREEEVVEVVEEQPIGEFLRRRLRGSSLVLRCRRARNQVDGIATILRTISYGNWN
jgi:hypothetical protein